MVKSLIAAFLMTSLAGCSALGEGTDKSERQVDVIHKLYNAKKFDRIYALTDEIYQKATTKKLNERFLKTIHKKLGKVEEKTRTGWQANTNMQGSFLVLIYDTKFENGQGVETFTMKLDNDRAKMAGYNIDSPALMIDLEE